MWWSSLSVLQQVFFCIACIATGVMILQTIIVAIGFGSDGALDFGGETGLDLSDGDSGIGAFIMRGLIAFFSISGWVGYGLCGTSLHTAVAVTLAVVAGCIAFVGMAFLIKAIMKLQNSGNLDYKNAIGLTAKVYIPIPQSRTGTGKVTLTLQERFVEVNAMTDNFETLTTDSLVVVKENIDNETLLVSPFTGVMGDLDRSL